MTNTQMLMTTGALALATILTRFLPFVVFPEGKKTPRFVEYLGKTLPAAVIGMLVIFCLKNVRPLNYPFGFPELLAIAATVGLHVWKRKTLLSIAGGTILYMLLVQTVFI